MLFSIKRGGGSGKVLGAVFLKGRCYNKTKHQDQTPNRGATILKPIPHQLAALISQAILAAQEGGKLPAFDLPPTIPVNPPKHADQGDYACAVAMALSKPAGMKPLDIAQAILDHLPPSERISAVQLAPPGFLNIRLNVDWLLAQVHAIAARGEAYFRQEVGAGKRAQVEFVSANPTGPLHIGRTRGAIIGSTLANILQACGFVVEREYYFNNAGRQMEMLGESLKARYLQALGENVALPEGGYQGDYLATMAQTLKSEVGADWREKDWAAFKEYAEKTIFQMIKTTLQRARVQHDVFFNENSLYDSGAVWQALEALKAKGVVYEAVYWEGASEDEKSRIKGDQPATWFRSTQLGDHQDRVLVKSNGDPTYVLPDIAYHMNKLNRGFDVCYNILGADHKDEAQTVAYGLTALGYDTAKVQVLMHQFVSFAEGKMSTRAGNYVTLDDLIDAVGADVVRYFMLARSHNTHIEFDFDLALKQSNENPVYYIQNAHVRCCGIFRQVAERGYPADWDANADLSLLGAAELAFLRKALELPEQLMLAYENAAPHQIAFWTLELARVFHPLYDNVRVLHTEVPEETARARLRFYRAARVVFAYALGIMGMTAPETM